MTSFAPPIVQIHEGVFVVREDVLAGGTKRRFVDAFVGQRRDDFDEFVYATTAYGGAQIALAHACRAAGRRAVVFVAKRKELHARTKEAAAAGAIIREVPMGFLSNVQAKTRDYCATRPRSCLMPFGFDSPEARAAIRDAAINVRSRYGVFAEAWCAVGSGVLIRSLQEACIAKHYVGIAVGRDIDKEDESVGGATVIRHPLQFGVDAKERPPFPSCSNYDAKVWSFVRERARRGVRSLFWNVMG